MNVTPIKDRPWAQREPGRLVGRGHPAGDFLEAYDWKILEERRGFMRLEIHLPEHCRNPRGQLFGGFTPTYVDFVALHTARAAMDQSENQRDMWLATSNMRIDYFDPVVGPRFFIESQVVRERRRMAFVETRFFDEQGTLLVFAVTTMRKIPVSGKLGDA